MFPENTKLIFETLYPSFFTPTHIRIEVISIILRLSLKVPKDTKMNVRANNMVCNSGSIHLFFLIYFLKIYLYERERE